MGGELFAQWSRVAVEWCWLCCLVGASCGLPGWRSGGVGSELCSFVELSMVESGVLGRGPFRIVESGVLGRSPFRVGTIRKAARDASHGHAWPGQALDSGVKDWGVAGRLTADMAVVGGAVPGVLASVGGLGLPCWGVGGRPSGAGEALGLWLRVVAQGRVGTQGRAVAGVSGACTCVMVGWRRVWAAGGAWCVVGVVRASGWQFGSSLRAAREGARCVHTGLGMFVSRPCSCARVRTG